MVLFGLEFRKYKNYKVKNDLYVESYISLFYKIFLKLIGFLFRQEILIMKCNNV